MIESEMLIVLRESEGDIEGISHEHGLMHTYTV